ncbi:MAG: 50S ribosomal protein L29 [Lentisphaerae bacterium]|mgnify:FL=1|jgi:large subunit ribosomal protein L29|nr:50S ribosomal protein L29 [Lentisphaerota bacterium]
MKPAEIREKTNEELDLEIEKCRKEIFDLRLKFQTNQLEDTSRIRLLRKDIARMETEKTARRKSAN